MTIPKKPTGRKLQKRIQEPEKAASTGKPEETSLSSSDLRFWKSLDKVNRITLGINDPEQMMRDVLDAVLSIFNCDRAFLLYACDPDAASWSVQMERTVSGYPDLLEKGTPFPMTPPVRDLFQTLLETKGVVELRAGKEFDPEKEPWKAYEIKSVLAAALHPKTGKPWTFGLHQCSSVRGWTEREKELFQEIAGRLACSLTRLLMYRDLEQSEAFLNTIIEHIPSLIFVKEAKDLRFVRFNKAGDKLRGSLQEMLIGKTDYDVFPKEEADYFTAKDREALNTNSIVDIPEEMIRIGMNEKRMFHTQKIPIRDETGKPKYLLGISEDITERKRMETALQESEKMYRRLTERMTDAVWMTDMNLKMTYVTPSIQTLLGFTQEERMQQTIDKQLSPDSLSLVMDTLAREIAFEKEGRGDPGRSVTLTLEYYHKDGSTRWMETAISGIRDHRGVLTGLLGANKDITDRIRAEKALKRNEEMLRLITENMSDMIRVTDMLGRNVYATSSHFKTLGYTPEERIGSSTFDVVHPDDIEMIIRKFAEDSPSHQPVRLQYRVRHAAGHYVWLDTVTDLIRDARGEVKGLVMSSRDITGQKQLEEERQKLKDRLQHAEKMEALGQLAGGVAHDLNNVLGALSGYSELLLAHIPPGQPGRRYVEKILQSTEKGAAIIQDLLTLARRGVVVSGVVNLNDVVSGFMKTPVFEKVRDYHPGVIFKTEMDQSLLNIKGSSVQLEKTLMNLVSNAAEAISGPGEVTIRTASRYLDKAVSGYDEVQEGDYAVLSVSDTGMGIPAEMREKIFEPFFTKKIMGRSGTGLGLAIVWGTVRDHNGYLEVQSDIGKGSTFLLYFPATQEALTAPQQIIPIEHYRGNGETVLVVDDIAEQRDVASGLLSCLGYKVCTASSGEEAVEYLKDHHAEILVLDMIMGPGIDGMETYRRILEIKPKQKAILVSGYSQTDRVREAQKLGAGAYVKKPYVMEKIGLALREELRR